MKNKIKSWFGFTLIELLVVALIVSLLVSIGAPQYQRVIEKARAAQVMPILQAFYVSARRYRSEHGEWPTEISELDVSVAKKRWPGTAAALNLDGSAISNGKWSIQLLTSENAYGVVAIRRGGSYRGGMFAIYRDPVISNLPTARLVCGEVTTGDFKLTGDANRYCEKIFHGTYLGKDAKSRFYSVSF